MAYADIFRYVNKDGLEYYTDAPVEKGATRIMKEKPLPRHTAAKPKVPSQPSAPVIAGETGTIPPATSVPAALSAKLPISGKITSTTGLRRDPIDGMLRFHQGVDIATPSGTVIRPVASGTVFYSGSRPGYGNLVIIAHDDGMHTLYAHNSANLAIIGDMVETGTAIALSGATGRATGPHLHFEAWKGGVNLTDSFTAMAAAGRSVTPSRHDDIRSVVQSDGSILFTNLPYN